MSSKRKQQQIQTIDRRNHAVFCRLQHFPYQSLKLPIDAIRWLGITPELFRALDKPTNIAPVIQYIGSDLLKFSVHQGKYQFKEYLIDVVLGLHHSSSQDTTLLMVHRYEDQAILHGNGIATAFYGRLDVIAGRMGVNYILGANKASNIDFFTRKLGRERVIDLPSAAKIIPKSILEVNAPEFMTIKAIPPYVSV